MTIDARDDFKGQAPASPSADFSLHEFARQVELPSKHSPYFKTWWDARKQLSDVAWDLHIANAYSHYRASHPGVPPTPLELSGLYDQGRLDAEDTAKLKTLFSDCPIVPYSADDFCPGYTFDVTGSLADYNTYRRMTPSFEAALSDVLAKIGPTVETLCGHYFRIVSSHIWSLNAGPHKYQWHLDCWPLGLKKLFIFPTGVDKDKGSTAFRQKTGEEKIAEGPPGTWIIFENSVLEHKGFESLTQSRPTIAISIAPAFRTDLRLFDAGVNSGYPWFPVEGDNPGVSRLPGEFYGQDMAATRRLKDTLELSGLGAYLTPDGRVKIPAPVHEAQAPPPVSQAPPSVSNNLERNQPGSSASLAVHARDLLMRIRHRIGKPQRP